MPQVPTLQELYSVHSDMVYNLCLNYLQNAPDAEEVTQDVFLQVHRKLGAFRGQSSWKTWIYRITVNKCLDHLKAKKRQKRFGIHIPLYSQSDSPLFSHFDHPGTLLEDKEAIKEIFRHINTLPEKQKTALLLKVTEGLSIKEIGEVMTMSVKAVESLLSRAKAGLRKKIAESEGKN